jgi:hypothetical protein
MDALKAIPKLEILDLNLVGPCRADTLYITTMDREGSSMIAGLKDAPSLRALRLDLSNVAIYSSGAAALATLKESSTLETLDLSLNNCEIRDDGIRALATLSEAPSLSTLRLQLRENPFFEDAAEYLFELLHRYRIGNGPRIQLDFEEELEIHPDWHRLERWQTLNWREADHKTWLRRE